VGQLEHIEWGVSSAGARGLVFGPDGRTLYLTLFSEKDFQRLGWILSYDTMTGAVKVVASYNPRATDQCSPYLSRPEGVAVGPNGNLYVAGRQPDTSLLYDKILAFNPASGACVRSIDLEAQPGQPHTYARALIFSPGGKLYLPMTVGTTTACPTVARPNAGGTDAGSVRAYDVSTGLYNDIVPSILPGSASDPSVYYTASPP
jgi:hypothetical protein